MSMGPEILTAISTVVSFVLIGILRDLRDGKSIFHRNGNDLGATMKHLKEHYNDELSEVLGRIETKLDKMLVDGVRIRE